MKTSTILLLLTLCVPLTRSFGQEFPANPTGRPGGGGGRGGGGSAGFTGGFGGGPMGATAEPRTVSEAVAKLPVFDLDFGGGDPKDLVVNIERVSGKPLNAIIPDEYANTHIPAFKMKGVNIAMLFEALQNSSRKQVPMVTSINTSPNGQRTPTYTYQNVGYGFRTEGVPTENSVWYFHVDNPTAPPLPQANEKICRFYQLGPYLDHDYKVEDITTAVETGWKMLGVKSLPSLNFHKETKLLIAVGEPDQLDVIDSVLGHLTITTGRTETRATSPKP